MKKSLKEILARITPETTVEEIISYCDGMEDFELILLNLPEYESKSVTLSDDIKQAAFSLVSLNKLNAAKSTNSFIQKNLNVSYPQAAAIVNWLKSLTY